MDLLPSSEQDEIVSVVAGFLRAELPINDLRVNREEHSSFTPAMWKKCGDLGWFGLGLSEELGGVGYGLVEEALLFRELGRHLAPGPFVASVLGARVAALAGNSALAASIVAGEASVGMAEARGAAVVSAAGISGTFDLLDGAGATHVLFHSDSGLALVEAAALGELPLLPCIDPGTRLTRAELNGAVPVVFLADGADAVLLRGTVLVSAMLCGIAESTRDLSSEYAKVREQFGKPIGVNQAIKHACANMAVRAEAATSQLFFAALAADENRGDAILQTSSARVVATNAAIENATATIQVHGGMGYTFEHDANLYFKRARILERTLGESRRHLDLLLHAPAAQ
jgi:alkylation response protein AidB-like acyl-CoA dehydrogenase